jgi:cytochrome c oxidase assembly protein Cox11
MKLIFSDWNFMRFLRLGLGTAIVVQSVMAGNWTMGILGLLFTAMPVFNIGCCATGSCSTATKKTSETTKEIIYEEVV